MMHWLETDAIYCCSLSILTIKDSIMGQHLCTGMATCAFFMVISAFAGNTFSTENGPSAPWTIFLWIIGYNNCCVNNLMIYVRWPYVRSKFLVIAILAVQVTVRSIIIGQAVQKFGAIHATEAIFVIPWSLRIDRKIQKSFKKFQWKSKHLNLLHENW